MLVLLVLGAAMVTGSIAGDVADAGWEGFAQSQAPAPSGPRLLLRVKVGIWLPVLRPRRRAHLGTLESSERRDHDLTAN